MVISLWLNHRNINSFDLARLYKLIGIELLQTQLMLYVVRVGDEEWLTSTSYAHLIHRVKVIVHNKVKTQEKMELAITIKSKYFIYETIDSA